MARNNGFILGSCCFKAQGDFGPLTCYTNKNMVVIFLKAWLRDPASPKQIAHRDRMRAAAKNWNETTPQNRKNFERASLKGQTKLNGYNLWVYGSMALGGISNLETIARQTGIILIMPPAT